MELLYTWHPVSSINVSHYRGTFVTTKEPTLAHYYEVSCTFYSDFTSFLLMSKTLSRVSYYISSSHFLNLFRSVTFS